MCLWHHPNNISVLVRRQLLVRLIKNDKSVPERVFDHGAPANRNVERSHDRSRAGVHQGLVSNVGILDEEISLRSNPFVHDQLCIVFRKMEGDRLFRLLDHGMPEAAVELGGRVEVIGL